MKTIANQQKINGTKDPTNTFFTFKQGISERDILGLISYSNPSSPNHDEIVLKYTALLIY